MPGREQSRCFERQNAQKHPVRDTYSHGNSSLEIQGMSIVVAIRSNDTYPHTESLGRNSVVHLDHH